MDTSYRTISTCPLVAKGLDIYVRELAIEKWNNLQADTQYQGEGSSHDLASLLVTEAIQHSRYHSHQPIFLLFLDAMSAFDIVNIPYIVRGLYQSGMECQSVMYMENRLANRITYCEYNKVLVGPIYDEQGLEQGGVSSSDCYKLYNNELLNISQQSCLGVDIGGQLVVSAVGQADDTVMMSNSLARLKHLCQLSHGYCQKFNVHLSPSKTKLLMLPSSKKDAHVFHNPIKINDTRVDFVDEAEHVGVLRSTSGNMPHILGRLSSFRKALGSVVSCGLARGHRSNPAASLRILTLYGTPVLMSGMASLVLLDKETATIDQQFKRTLQTFLSFL